MRVAFGQSSHEPARSRNTGTGSAGRTGAGRSPPGSRPRRTRHSGRADRPRAKRSILPGNREPQTARNSPGRVPVGVVPVLFKMALQSGFSGSGRSMPEAMAAGNPTDDSALVRGLTSTGERPRWHYAPGTQVLSMTDRTTAEPQGQEQSTKQKTCSGNQLNSARFRPEAACPRGSRWTRTPAGDFRNRLVSRGLSHV